MIAVLDSHYFVLRVSGVKIQIMVHRIITNCLIIIQRGYFQYQRNEIAIFGIFAINVYEGSSSVQR